jgi:SIR2-like domain
VSDVPPFDAVAAARDARAHGLVIVAGAGLSMAPPSSLPGWNAINNAFLENLALLLSEHLDDGLPYQVAELIAERRETAAVAQPDLQAQLAEESLGEHYFALFKPLDIEAWNDGHAALAAIAQTGHLRAIVTTNFDRLIELGLRKVGIEPRLYCAPDDFERLPGDVDSAATGASTSVPVIKVHGSVDQPATMVDTLRQRVLGRPKPLEDALSRLFAQHAVLLVGFSGADLAYDPRYLGLRDGASRSPSFTVVSRSKPKPALAELIEAAPANARAVRGDLPRCLIELARALGNKGALCEPGWDPEHQTPGIRKAGLPGDVHRSLGSSISPVRAAVILARLAEIAGSSDAAMKLLTSSMPHHIGKKLLADLAMPEHIGLIAGHLIESGHIARDLSEGWFKGELAANDVLSIKEVRLTTDSLAQAALANALVGDAIHSDAMGLKALRESREDFRPTVRADTICALARSWTIVERWEGPLVVALRQAYDFMHDWGDEPRKARVGALLARFLIATGDLDGAREVVLTCQDVVRRLNLAVVGNEVIAAAGRLHLAEGRYDRALSALRSACKHLEASQHLLRLAETLLPLAEAAALAGDAQTMQRARASFESLLPLMPGLALPDAASRVRMLCRAGEHEEARKVIGDLRTLGEQWGDHVWIAPLADRLTADADRAPGS